ncbi:GntR family transcriptional regulator [Actinopolyspora saharensis]|uniref:DNA-binding transcriptional regulator, GntR family n=1 Tax=Actinopolyspora saharensis TaxID=995062 RepID=A0A1H0ZIE0_9ACTN|nr:GntR family transcriptional regulator [Actinopolyspora saharensis]SDQ26921.1 DNA-binding transcriptional regulator, GntR family [Actinopolyspora saharensis]
MPENRTRRRPSVDLYERIVEGIRSGQYPPGSTLPSEPVLAAELGVGRPALREALILLQEDGVITVRRGVGRTVSTGTPRRGFERLLPVEDLFPGRTRVRALTRSREEPTDFVLQHLPVPANSEVGFWESVVDVDDWPGCLVQEWALPDETLARVHAELPAALATTAGRGRTMLAVLSERGYDLSLRGSSGMTATVLGKQRGEIFERPADTPVVLVTQLVSAESTPLLVGKYVFPSGAPAVPLLQSR